MATGWLQMPISKHTARQSLKKKGFFTFEQRFEDCGDSE